MAERASLTKAGHALLSNLINGLSQSKAAAEKAISDGIKDVKEWGMNGVSIGQDADPNTFFD